jgi:dihydroneopterin aldolase
MAGTDQLQLNGIEVSCIIGDRPDERRREQILLVDVALVIDLAAAEASDLLVDTVDYPALAEAIRQRLRTARCQMIEHAAGLVAAECLKDGRVSSVRVRVEKRGAVVGLHNAAVVIIRSR